MQSRRPGDPAGEAAGAPAGHVTAFFARHAALFAVVLVCAAFISFAPSLTAGFTSWDDHEYVTENPLIRDLSAAGLLRIFTTPHQNNYHPLTLLTHAVEYRLFGLDPLVYHLGNLVLHAANAVLLLAVLLLFTRRFFLAGAVSLLWAIHPLHVESVTWVSERRDVLFTFFLLAALASYLLAARTERPRWRRAALALFVLSCLSKAMAVSFPFVLLLVEYFGERTVHPREVARRVLPFFIVGGIFLAISLRIRAATGDFSPGNAAYWHHHVFVASYALLFYIRKMILPVDLSALYPYPDAVGFALPWPYLISPAVVLILAGLVWTCRKWSRDLAFGSLFFLVTIALILEQGPTGLDVTADRYAYLPSIGLLFAAGSFLERGYAWGSRHAIVVRRSLAAAFCALCVLLSIMTWNRTKVWKDSLTLWEDVLRQFPDSAVGLLNRGTAHHERGEFEAALADYTRAIEVNPRFARAYHDRGILHLDRGRPDEALADFGAVIGLTPRDPLAYLVRGTVLLDRNRAGEAIEDFSIAARLAPSNIDVRIMRARALLARGLRDEALADLDAALALEPGNATVAEMRAAAARSAPGPGSYKLPPPGPPRP